MGNNFSFSSSPLTRITNSKYYDLDQTLKAMMKFWNFSVIQGFEFQYLAEWNRLFPPKDKDPRYDRLTSWNDSKKYDPEKIADFLNDYSLPIFSIHGNRDIGILLCSKNNKDVKNGKLLIKNSINLAERVGAKICVFHIWDTKIDKIDYVILKKTLDRIAIKHPTITLSVENIPTNMPNFTPFELLKNFEYITMDLRWCAVYDELFKFSKIKKKIVNIHIRGELSGDEWKLRNSPFTVEEAMEIIIKQWKYKGLLTFEPEGGLIGANWENLIKAIEAIQRQFSLG
ncbi:MAG: hypothetical protein EU533_02890 [Promethearchaeota archaeon]|nr:MAG: hypothetical protein EU533_02890 [Candidatus Lokiarchaeota archaeon]